jgi:hypothetical protein
MDVSRTPLNPVNAIGSAARAVVSRIEEALDHLEDLVVGVRAMERELTGMRRDVRALGKKVDGLRGDVQGMHAGVDGIRAATESLDQRFPEVPDRLARVDEGIVGLATSLESVDALVGRLGRLGRRSRRARTPVEEEVQEAEAGALDGQIVSADPEGPAEAPKPASPQPSAIPEDRPQGP